jgi:hypothetical protein
MMHAVEPSAAVRGCWGVSVAVRHLHSRIGRPQRRVIRDDIRAAIVSTRELETQRLRQVQLRIRRHREASHLSLLKRHSLRGAPAHHRAPQ